MKMSISNLLISQKKSRLRLLDDELFWDMHSAHKYLISQGMVVNCIVLIPVIDEEEKWIVPRNYLDFIPFNIPK